MSEPYKIKILFGQRREDYEGQYAPEVLVAVDEFSDHENSSYFIKKVDKVKKEQGSYMRNMQIIEIEIPMVEIDKILNPDVIKLAKIVKK